MISNLLDNGFGGGDKGCYCSCFSAISVDLFSDHELLMRENVCIPHPPPQRSWLLAMWSHTNHRTLTHWNCKMSLHNIIVMLAIGCVTGSVVTVVNNNNQNSRLQWLITSALWSIFLPQLLWVAWQAPTAGASHS